MPGDSQNEFKDSVWIRTFSGGKFTLHSEDNNEIQIEDIAHALSNQCRYTGHVRTFYSVAEHSVMVSQIVERLGGTKEEVKAGLLHDASEAYLSDMAAPFKPEIKGYWEVEKLIEKRIYDRFHIEGKSDLVKKADWLALFIEAKELMNTDPSDWNGYDEHWQDAMDLKMIPYCWIPQYAKVAFLDRYMMLFEEEQDVA